MAKLYFRHGTMGSAKTLNLLAAAHTYQIQGKKVLILKPELDTRFGQDLVKSRSGLEKPADILIREGSRLSLEQLAGISCILVDEVQFIAPSFIEQLRDISRDLDIPVICYGLRSDFRTRLFEGSKRLLELADNIEEIKNTCHYCNKKAIFNLRLIKGLAALDGPQVQLGGDESYVATCPVCYERKQNEARQAAKMDRPAEPKP